MAALAHAFVRPLLRAQCEAVRGAAERVVCGAAERRLDPEAIHDHRVALRRLRTLLDAAAPLFKRGPLAAVRGGLRRLARAAGAVRDEEVLGETIGALVLPAATAGRVQAWLRGRARREQALRRAVVAELARPAGDAAPAAPAPSPPAPAPSPPADPASTLAPAPAPAPPPPLALADLLTLAEALPLRRRAESISTRALAIAALRDAAQKTLREAARPDADRPERLHRLRIRWKGVRYTGELFTRSLAASGPVAKALEARVKAATRMQKRLGELHDLDEALARTARARSLGAGDRMVVHHGLQRGRGALIERLRDELPAALALLPDGNAAGPIE